MVRLSSTVLRQFKYWKRYMYREMYRDLQPRKVLLPIVGWKEDKVKEWNIDESQPWTQEFHAKNKPWVKKTSKMWVQPIKNWPYYKGDVVEILVGPDEGKKGTISYMVKQRNWVFVEGLNCEYEIVETRKGLPPTCIKKERPLLVPDQVKLVDPADDTPTEIEWRYSEKGERVRVSKRTGRIIPIPAMADMCEDFVYPKSYKEGSKDTKESDLTKVTFEPKLKLFEDDIMESMNIKETRKRTKTYWY